MLLSAYVTKANITTDLVQAIREALKGGKYISGDNQIVIRTERGREKRRRLAHQLGP